MPVLHFQYPSGPNETLTSTLSLQLPLQNDPQVQQVVAHITSHLKHCSCKEELTILHQETPYTISAFETFLRSQGLQGTAHLYFHVLHDASNCQQQNSIQVTSSYNSVSQELLKSFDSEHAQKVTTTLSRLQSTPPEILKTLDQLQQSLKSGQTTADQYRMSVEDTLTRWEPLDKLQGELLALKPQLYDDTAPPNGEWPENLDPHTQVHQHLHTLHVIPVLRAVTKNYSFRSGHNQGIDHDAKRCVLPVNSWTKFVTACRICFDEHPLQFGAVTLLFWTQLHQILHAELSPLLHLINQQDIQQPQDIDVVKHLMKLYCIALKDHHLAWAHLLSSDAERKITATRRLAKIIYHQQTPIKVYHLDNLLTHTIETLQLCQTELDSQNAQYNVPLTFFHDVLHKWLLTHAFKICSYLDVINAKLNATGILSPRKLSSADFSNEPQIASAPDHATCSHCGGDIERLCLYNISDKSFLRCSCVIKEPDLVIGFPNNTIIPVVIGRSITSPHVASAHLMAHQQNLLEQVVGTRKTVLPDKSTAILTTSVSDVKTPIDSAPMRYRRVQKKDSEVKTGTERNSGGDSSTPSSGQLKSGRSCGRYENGVPGFAAPLKSARTRPVLSPRKAKSAV